MMRRKCAGNPVIIEITIVVLFFAVAAAASMRLFTAISLTNTRNDMNVSAAADCASAIDAVKADPGSLAFSGGVCEYEVSPQLEGYTVSVRVEISGTSPNGTLYDITATAAAGPDKLVSLENAFFDYEGGERS